MNYKLIGNILLLVITISFVYLLITQRLQVFYVPKLEPANYSSDCSNLSLEFTARCLRRELGKWYNYNLTNIGKDLTIEELKTVGGVCTQYAQWYDENFKSLGFESKQISIKINSTNAHRFTIVSSSDGYCLLDQLIVECVDMKDEG